MKLDRAMRYIMTLTKSYNAEMLTNKQAAAQQVTRLTSAAHALYSVGITVTYYLDHGIIVAVKIADDETEGVAKTDMGVQITGRYTPDDLSKYMVWELSY